MAHSGLPGASGPRCRRRRRRRGRERSDPPPREPGRAERGLPSRRAVPQARGLCDPAGRGLRGRPGPRPPGAGERPPRATCAAAQAPRKGCRAQRRTRTPRLPGWSKFFGRAARQGPAGQRAGRSWGGVRGVHASGGARWEGRTWVWGGPQLSLPAREAPSGSGPHGGISGPGRGEGGEEVSAVLLKRAAQPGRCQACCQKHILYCDIL